MTKTQLAPTFFNKNLFLLILCQGLYLTNNITFIAINGLVGMSLTPIAWLATLPLMAYVVGAALATSLVAKASKSFWSKSVISNCFSSCIVFNLIVCICYL
jgi:uncharacterized membrane protein YoaK (UPF0700 family)